MYVNNFLIKPDSVCRLLVFSVVESLVKKSKQFIGTVPGTVVGTKTMACKHGIGPNIWQKDRYRRKAQVKVGNC